MSYWVQLQQRSHNTFVSSLLRDNRKIIKKEQTEIQNADTWIIQANNDCPMNNSSNHTDLKE